MLRRGFGQSSPLVSRCCVAAQPTTAAARRPLTTGRDGPSSNTTAPTATTSRRLWAAARTLFTQREMSDEAGKGASYADATTMSVSALKKELTSFGVTDFSECLYKEDLVAKLDAARAAKPTPSATPKSFDKKKALHGHLRYGRTATVGNTRNPTGLVVFCHGLGDTCDGWASMLEEWSLRHKHLLFVLPTAAEQKVTMNMGMAMPSWYDIKGISLTAPEDVAGVFISVSKVEELVADACAKHKIDAARVVYGGFSQGAVVSLSTGLTTSPAPAGIMALSGYLGAREEVAKRCKNPATPIFMAHGTADPVIPYVMSQGSHQLLTGAVKATQVEYKAYPGMPHSSCPQEMADASSWLGKVLPPL
jgi:predicted esterase